MKRLASVLCFVLFVLTGADLHASDNTAIAFEGSYLLMEDDGHQRMISLDRGGIITQISDQEALIGFTSGRGVWKQTSPNTVTARVVDFSYDLKDGKPIGPAAVTYELTFSGPSNGKFNQISGSYTVAQFERGQNPLETTKKPIRSYGIAFKGERIRFK